MQKKILIFIFTLYSLNVFAEIDLDFQHIHLSPSFVQKLNKQNQRSSKSLIQQDQKSWQDDLIPVVFNQEAYEATLEARSHKSEDGHIPLLYQTIRDYLGTQYQSIGQTESQRINDFNQQFNMGSVNFSGFSWQKPFGGFNLYVDRQLSPDLFDNKRYIVQDTFQIKIEATTYLGKLAEGGIINMSASEIAAFAGINFTRTYYSYQYANSFMQGLIADYTALFLPFIRMTPQNAWSLPEGNLIKREDLWQIGVGAIAETPSWYGFSFTGGVLAQFTHKALTTLQVVTPSEAQNKLEKIRISHSSEKTVSAGGAISMQLDFFKILKLTLLSGEFSYEATTNKEFHLSFQNTDHESIESHPEKSKEFNKLILSAHPNIQYLEPYVTRLDESTERRSNTSLNLLVYSILKKKNLEHVRIIKNQEVKTFFKSYSESVRLIQNFISRLISEAVFGLLSFKTGIKNDAQFSRKISIEYEATLPQSADPKAMSIEKSEQFSMNVQFDYSAAKTHNWISRKYKKDVLKFYDQFTYFEQDYKPMLEKDQLRGPISLTSVVRVNFEGLEYFNQQSVDNVFYHLAQVCSSKRSLEWTKEVRRNIFLKRLQIGKEICVKNLGLEYLKYKKIMQDLKRIDLAVLKTIMQKVVKKSKDLSALQGLFGESVFIHGSLLATTNTGIPFQTHFKSGQFKGLGIIDNYKRQSGTRAPLSIYID